MKIEMYVLCVLKFKDGRIIFDTDELTKIKDAIAAGLQKQQPLTVFTSAKLKRESHDGFEIYSWDPREIGSRLSEGTTIKSEEIGYYHHRVIVYLKLDSTIDFSGLREIRDQLKRQADGMIKCGVKEEINALVYAGQIRPEAEVEFFYTYPLIVLKRRRKRSFPFSEETSSLCFDIVEPSWFKPPWGRRHMMRVSVPSAILYPSRWGVGTDLLRDIVNVIYQYCLYEQKSRVKKPFENVLDENLLAKFWEQIFNRLGSRTVEVHISRFTFATFLLTSILVALTVIYIIRL